MVNLVKITISSKGLRMKVPFTEKVAAKAAKVIEAPVHHLENYNPAVQLLGQGVCFALAGAVTAPALVGEVLFVGGRSLLRGIQKARNN